MVSTTVCAIFAVADVSGGDYRLSIKIFIRIPAPSRSGEPCNEEVAQDQSIHLRTLQPVNGLFGAADNGFVVVERGVQDNGYIGNVAERRNQRVVARICFARDRLQAAGAIDMCR